VKHWLCWQQSNYEAAVYIVHHRDDPALACLTQWAELYLSRHPESSPVEPGSEAEKEFELS
jgi:hypothetical protein